jgi:hypothetical protein
MAVGGAVSIWLFSDQTKYQGLIAKAHPGVGDLTFEVGFALAAVLYFVLFRVTRPAAGVTADATASGATSGTVLK